MHKTYYWGMAHHSVAGGFNSWALLVSALLAAAFVAVMMASHRHTSVNVR